MAKLSYMDWAEALYEVTHGKTGAPLAKALNGFAALLSSYHHVHKAPRIISAYEKICARKAGEVHIAITTARHESKEVIEAIKKAFGKNVIATTTVDESIVGGFVAQSENTIFDGSLRTQLKNLKQHLLA